MTGARDITQLCFSSNLAGILANKIEQSFYSVYSYSGMESIEHALSLHSSSVTKPTTQFTATKPFKVFMHNIPGFYCPFSVKWKSPQPNPNQP